MPNSKRLKFVIQMSTTKLYQPFWSAFAETVFDTPATFVAAAACSSASARASRAASLAAASALASLRAAAAVIFGLRHCAQNDANHLVKAYTAGRRTR